MIIITMIANWLMRRRSSMTQSRATFLAKAFLATLAAILATVLFLVWLDAREDAAVEADRAAHNAQVATEAREADERAGEVVRAEQAETRERVENAREEAEASDDPLAAGLRGLR